MTDSRNHRGIGGVLKRQRRLMALTLRELTEKSGVSSSHLGRIERGERHPSALVLRKLARPLGFAEGELFSLAGYLSPPSVGLKESSVPYSRGHLDPYVSQVLSQETVEIQRAALGILNILQSLAKALR